MKVWLISLLGLVIFSSCKAFINLKIPPITITNAQTAAEKQMVGEDRELERDSWLLSSIQSSSNGTQSLGKTPPPQYPKDSLEYGHFQRIIYFTPEVKRYKSHGVLGEALGGVLRWNPEAKDSPFYSIYQDSEKRKKVDSVISQINESRKILLEKQLEREKSKGQSAEDLKNLEQEILETYRKQVQKGEYYENKNGKWEKKV